MSKTSPKESTASETQTQALVQVAENLYRSDSSGIYYSLFKRGGKQFRKSLKTDDRKLADKRLAEVRAKVDNLVSTGDAKLTFRQVAEKYAGPLGPEKDGDTEWKLKPGTQTHLKPRSLLRLKTCLKNLAPFFGETP